jgi:anti-sigma B factor antagonist
MLRARSVVTLREDAEHWTDERAYCCSGGARNHLLRMAPTEAPSAATAAGLQIEGSMTFARATELHRAMLDALQAQPSPVEFDLSDVTEIDSAGVQLLLLAKRTAAASDKELKLVGQSSAVLRALELLRLDTHFGQPAFCLFDEDSP